MQPNAVLALLIFVLTVAVVIWRPKGVNEMIPALLGGLATLAFGLTGLPDVSQILVIVSNAAITIISTFVMASVLAQVGFFRWTALNLARRAGGAGIRLWVYVLLLAIAMTLFLNNDGSILIATPIICELTRRLGLDRRSTTPFILGSALVATASSAPIGVSNPANLEAMVLAGFSLTTHTEYMFLPSMFGLSAILALLYLRFRRDIPMSYSVEALDEVSAVEVDEPHPPQAPPKRPWRPPVHPLHALRRPPHPQVGHSLPPRGPERKVQAKKPRRVPDWGADLITDVGLMQFTVVVVVLVRLGYFIASLYHIPTSAVALIGAVVVVVASLSSKSLRVSAVLKESPWHILLFAFGMELVVFGLRNAGLIAALGDSVAPLLRTSLWATVLLPGTAIGLLACLMNNHPALLAGTLTLTSLGLDEVPMKLGYTSLVLGSDILSLLTPMGTLASLLWFHLIRQQGVQFSWGDYIATSVRVIPLSFAASLLGLYVWALIVGG